MADLMANWSSFHITDKGLDLRQRAIAEKLDINFIRAEIGEGKPSSESDVWTMTALISSAKEVTIYRSVASGANHCMVIQINNFGYTDEILMREIGVFAQLQDNLGNPVGGEVLYGYSYTIHGYDPIPSGSSSPRVWEITMDVAISRSADIRIIYDGSAVFVSHFEYDGHLPIHKLITILHNLGCHPGVEVFGTLQWGAGMGGAGDGPAGGTAMEQIPFKAVWEDRNTLTLYTTQAAVRPGIVKQLHGGGREWTVTFEGDELSSLYILLTGGTQSGGNEIPVLPSSVKVSPSMGLRMI